MDINTIILWIMMACMVLGGIDRAIGNKFGLGEQFEEGFNAMGPLALAMVGMMSLSPVLAKLLTPVIGPLYSFFGADPAMFAGTLIAVDMGGWPLAQEMTTNADIQQLSGLVLGSMMGATIVFTIPVSLSIIKKEDRGFLAKGVLAGIVGIPVGVLVSGLLAGFPVKLVLINLIPVVLIALLIVLGLALIPDKMTTGFDWFGKILTAVITVGLILGVIEETMDIQIMPKGWELTPPSEGIAAVGLIGVVLLGAFPMVHLIVKFASKPLGKVGKLLGMNDSAAGGMIATLANNIAMFGIFKDMDARGKVLNAAFAVSAAFALGDHLGFVAGMAKDMVAPVLAGKLVAGICGVVIAYVIFARKMPKAEEVAATDKAEDLEAVAEEIGKTVVEDN